MEASFHLGRQPIINRNGELVAYELLFRNSSQNQANVTDDFIATAHVIQNTFSQIGLDQVLGEHLGFINIDASLLLSDVLELLPPKQMVLEILETVETTPEIIQRCVALRQKGFQFALDDIVKITSMHKDILPQIQYVKLDLIAATPEQINRTVYELKRHKVKLLAEKIDTQAQYEHCKRLGFDLFQGYFFARPTILSGQKLNPSQTALLQLLGLVQSDSDSEAIEVAFKRAPELTVNLLKLVNSVASGVACKIDSVKRAVTVLGRRQLGRWIQLLVYTEQSGSLGATDPLAQTAAIRGKLMELAAQKHHPQDRNLPDKAFMVGMLSLLDALFRQPLPDLIAPLNLSDDVREALLERQGLLGEMLRQAENLEKDCPLNAGAFSECEMLLQAMAWANDLNK